MNAPRSPREGPADEASARYRSGLRLIALVVVLTLAWFSFAIPTARERGQNPEAPTGANRPEAPEPPPTGPRAAPEPVSRAPAATPERQAAETGVAPDQREPHARKATVAIAVRAAGSLSAVPRASLEVGYTPRDAEEEHVQLLEVDERGRLELDLEAGTLRLAAWSERGVGGPLFVELDPGARVERTLELELAYEVAGRVVDAESGLPIAGAEVAFWTFAERDVVKTGPDGGFRHPRFPRTGMSEQVRASARGHGASVRYLAFEEDGSWRLPDPLERTELAGTGVPFLELALPPELVLSGTLVDARGEPLGGASTSVEGYFRVLPSVAARDGADVVTDDEGRFEVRGLRADIGHAVFVAARGHAEVSFEIPAGTRGVFDLGTIAPARDARLAGVVVDAEGFPVVDARVVLTPTREDEQPDEVATGHLDVAVRVLGSEREVRTGHEGTFLFEGLDETAYRVDVARDGESLVSVLTEPLPSGDHPFAQLFLPPRALTLRGLVRGPEARDAEVTLRRFGHVTRVRTDAQGVFRIAGLDGGAPYELRVLARSATAERTVWAHEEPILDLGRAPEATTVSLAVEVER